MNTAIPARHKMVSMGAIVHNSNKQTTKQTTIMIKPGKKIKITDSKLFSNFTNNHDAHTIP